MTPEFLLMRGGINNPQFASVTEMKARLNCCFVAYIESFGCQKDGCSHVVQFSCMYYMYIYSYMCVNTYHIIIYTHMYWYHK